MTGKLVDAFNRRCSLHKLIWENDDGYQDNGGSGLGNNCI